ncbi:hypothetical protein [Escherichia coli]|uniref:hypothetical protein n=1 Tax=Escherichia coli TaxID=562 RepID=UPI00201CB23E|nr:hypothetical protein [Escherichia coli]
MEKVIIELDNRWELADFAVLTKEYLQLYGFFYGLKGGSRGYSTMPWEGGHSVVNFFRGAYSATPPDLRPVVKKIQYASPGFIELSALIDISWQIAELVTAVGGSILAANKVYDQVMRTYRQREWAKLKSEKLRIQNQIKEIELVSDAVKSLESVMALSEEQRKNLVQLSGADELVQLKILLAVYRRLSPLVELQNSGKANFSVGKNKNLKASD